MKEVKKIKQILIKISEIEKDEIKRKSKDLGLNMSDYIRKSALNKRIIIKTDKEMVRQIRYVGVNINQISRQLNTYSDSIIIAEAYIQMEEYKQMLQTILDNIEKK
jgi:N-acyl-L-homoserine lactone synthetase